LGATVWRWLSQDAIRPWRHRSWIFPRDPLFVEKAGPILDLYQGLWQGQPLGPKDFVLSADWKTGIQARHREHPSLPPAPDAQEPNDREPASGARQTRQRDSDTHAQSETPGRIDRREQAARD